MSKSYPSSQSDRLPAAPLLAVSLALVIIIVAIAWAFIALVRHVNDVERDCIKHNGKTYCEEMLQ